MATDLPLEVEESTPSRVMVASSDATRDPIELIPICESDPKPQNSIPHYFTKNEEPLVLDEETEEKFQRYIKRMKETDGFDGGHLRPDTAKWGGVHLMDIDPDNPDDFVKDCVDFVITEHNSNPKWGMKLELCKISKANQSFCSGANYYITFSAFDLLSEEKASKDYEARVWRRWDGHKKTSIFREKGSSKQVFKSDDRIVW